MGLEALEPVSGPFPEDRIIGAGECLGDFGVATRRLVTEGFVTPDLQVGFTLHLLATQPRPPRPEGATSKPKKASGIAGGVWVREQITFHRPLASGDAFMVTGETARRFVKKHRRYTTTTSQTHDSAGRLVAENCTTGLVGYKPDPTLPDSSEGLAEADVATPAVADEHAATNPALRSLRNLSVGDTFTAPPQMVTLDMMRVRDGANSANPIHTDPEEARKSGLAAPIAGGSHVLSFALETLLTELGSYALSHGAHLDVRWFTPTFVDTTVTPMVRVSSIADDRVSFDLEVVGDDGPRMKGSVIIPMGAAA